MISCGGSVKVPDPKGFNYFYVPCLYEVVATHSPLLRAAMSAENEPVVAYVLMLCLASMVGDYMDAIISEHNQKGAKLMKGKLTTGVLKRIKWVNSVNPQLEGLWE